MGASEGIQVPRAHREVRSGCVEAASGEFPTRAGRAAPGGVEAASGEFPARAGRGGDDPGAGGMPG